MFGLELCCENISWTSLRSDINRAFINILCISLVEWNSFNVDNRHIGMEYFEITIFENVTFHVPSSSFKNKTINIATISWRCRLNFRSGLFQDFSLDTHSVQRITIFTGRCLHDSCQESHWIEKA